MVAGCHQIVERMEKTMLTELRIKLSSYPAYSPEWWRINDQITKLMQRSNAR